MADDFVREGLALHVARHIEVLCFTANPGPWRLVVGTSTENALSVIKRWNDRSIDIFAMLLRTPGSTPKSAIAKRARCSRNAVEGFWSDTLANAAILVYVGESTEPVKQRIFPRGVRISSPDGVRIVLQKATISYSDLRRIYEGNKPIVDAANENHAAVVQQIEAHPDREAAERERARVTEQKAPQLALIRTGTAE